MHHRTRTLLAAIPLSAMLLLAACGDDDTVDTSTGDELPVDDSSTGDEGDTRPVGSGDFDDTPDPATMCLPDEPDCTDTVSTDNDGDDLDDGSNIDEGALIREAEALIGTPESELDPDIRIGRRGEETFALTEDYVIGRFTVELDDQGDGFVVTSVVLELTEGPMTIE